MFKSLIALFVLATPLLVVANKEVDACPSGTSLEPVEFVKSVGKQEEITFECKCVNSKGKSKDFNAGCSAELSFEWFSPKCTPKCPKAPQPSGKGKGKGKKRSQTHLLPDGSPSPCAAADLACPIPGTFDSASSNVSKTTEYECIRPEEDIDNCGGCASTGQGMSCADIPGVRGTTCVRGQCEIYSCARGFVLRTDIDGTKYCRKTFTHINGHSS